MCLQQQGVYQKFGTIKIEIMKDLRVAVAGLGRIGKIHLNGILSVNEALRAWSKLY